MSSPADVPALPPLHPEKLPPPLTISLAKRQVQQEGRGLIRLPPQAFRLLTFLASAPERVISRDELRNRVWAGTFVTHRSVDIAIYDLRKILDPQKLHDREAYIITTPGVGYHLAQPVIWVDGSYTEPAGRTVKVGRTYTTLDGSIVTPINLAFAQGLGDVVVLVDASPVWKVQPVAQFLADHRLVRSSIRPPAAPKPRPGDSTLTTP